MFHDLCAYPTGNPTFMMKFDDSSYSWQGSYDVTAIGEIFDDAGTLTLQHPIEYTSEQIVALMKKLCAVISQQICEISRFHGVDLASALQIFQCIKDTDKHDEIVELYRRGVRSIPESTPWNTRKSVGTFSGPDGQLVWNYVTFSQKMTMEIGYMCLLRQLHSRLRNEDLEN